eukprot:4855154-Prymnesium_polylepis.1
MAHVLPVRSVWAHLDPTSASLSPRGPQGPVRDCHARTAPIMTDGGLLAIAVHRSAQDSLDLARPPMSAPHRRLRKGHVTCSQGAGSVGAESRLAYLIGVAILGVQTPQSRMDVVAMAQTENGLMSQGWQ